MRDQASDREEVVTPLMLDGTYLSRNFATLGPMIRQPPCETNKKLRHILFRAVYRLHFLGLHLNCLYNSMRCKNERLALRHGIKEQDDETLEPAVTSLCLHPNPSIHLRVNPSSTSLSSLYLMLQSLFLKTYEMLNQEKGR